MKKKICIVCVLCATSSWLLGMEQQQPRPATAAAIARSADIAEMTTKLQAIDLDAPVVLPIDLPQLPPIFLVSKQDRSGYAINPDVIKHSGFLTGFVDFKTAQELQQSSTKKKNPVKHFVINLPGKHLSIMVQLLQFFHAHYQRDLSVEKLQTYIQQITNNFSTITIAQLYKTLQYFMVPEIMLQALVSMRQPFPLPTNEREAIAYNQQLADILHIVCPSSTNEEGFAEIGDKALWQLFGRMLYPDCMRYAEVQRMFDGIKERFDEKSAELLLHEIMLGEYMQQHPELYGHPLQSLAGHRSTINSVAFSPDGKLIVSGSDDGAINVWVVGESSRRPIQVSGSSVNTLAFSPDGTLVASGSNNGHIHIWGIDGSLQCTFQHSPYAVYSVAFSPDGTMLVSSNSNGEVILWNARTGLPIRTFENKDVNYSTYSVAFSPDGQSVVASNNIGIRLWNVANGSQKGQLMDTEKEYVYYTVLSVAYSPDNSMIVAGLGDKKIQLWQVADKKLLHTFDGHGGIIQSVTFSPDGRSIISGSNDHTIRIWNVVDKKLARIIHVGHNGFIDTVAASRNGTMIVSGSGHGHEALENQPTLCLVQLWGYRDLFEALQSPLAASSYTYARKRMVSVAQKPIVVRAAASPRQSEQVQSRPLFTPGFLEKAFADTAETCSLMFQEINDDDEPVVLPAPLPEEK